MKLPSVDSVETLSLGAMRRLVAGLVGKMQKLEAEVGALRVENQMLRDEVARQPRMRTARNETLPASLPPFGVGRTKAAALFDISESLFDKLVSVGKMPQPRAANLGRFRVG
ncbi:hypothetical protein [Phyllobacterium zundukense]|uniref:Uncharacterized protein n=1 Tax=Phyllobacterium zundukense TaxID=1867719 RepID=A0ACD4CZ88_9HYPH|nr:hypothetical protein [Phyllobacterium zundukense]UXN58780.1 hypothetical protein N8E88_07595 [Phyllobacterium zundukense]